MNILVVCHYGLYSDLSSSFVHNQAKAYAKLGHNVLVIIPIAIGKAGVDQKRIQFFPIKRIVDGVRLCYVRYVSLSAYGDKKFNVQSAIASLRFCIDDILAGFDPDVIHAHTIGFDSNIGAWLKKRLNRSLVVTTHGSDTSIPLAKGKKEFLKRCCDQADRVVAVSSVLANKLKQCKTTTPICSILNGFNVQYMPTDYQKKALSFIQVGHLIPQKKVDVTIRAFAQIRERYPVATLRIIGSGSERGALESLCHELGIDDSVCFMGQVPNQVVMEEMAKAQFFVMPSVCEGFGIVYIEAMAAGCITIGTEGEGISELIESGKNGFLVPPDDPNAIVLAVNNCLLHSIESGELISQGMKAAKSLCWEKNAQQYIALFRRYLNHAKMVNK